MLKGTSFSGAGWIRKAVSMHERDVAGVVECDLLGSYSFRGCNNSSDRFVTAARQSSFLIHFYHPLRFFVAWLWFWLV